MSKSVSAPVKLLLQKYGDKLANRSMSREQLVEAANSLVSRTSRPEINRSWGDQVKDSNMSDKKKK